MKLIVGTQWGDEGKGKVVDIMADKADVIARYQGGANAGHTVIIGDKKYILHLLPSGILHRDKICVIGNGLVVDLLKVKEEVAVLKKKGISAKGRLFISGNATLILPHHKVLDITAEKRKGKTKIGTTGRGIGPAYTDKISRRAVKVQDLFSSSFKNKVKVNMEQAVTVLKSRKARQSEVKKVLDSLELGRFYDSKKMFNMKAYDEFVRVAKMFDITDTGAMMDKFIRQKKKIIIEGAQGTLLDIDHGTYPYVTSSNPTAGYAATGLGIAPRNIKEIIGIVKAYTTRVGGGPFPTELNDASGQRLRDQGGEYGSTTGRPRRCGWLDMVALKYANRLNGLDKLVITKMDVLDGLKKIKICTGYRYKGKVITDFPTSAEVLEKVKPVYIELPGWSEDTSKIRSFKKLPKNCQAYAKKIQKLSGVKVSIVSVGPERNQTIRV